MLHAFPFLQLTSSPASGISVLSLIVGCLDPSIVESFRIAEVLYSLGVLPFFNFCRCAFRKCTAITMPMLCECDL